MGKGSKLCFTVLYVYSIGYFLSLLLLFLWPQAFFVLNIPQVRWVCLIQKTCRWHLTMQSLLAAQNLLGQAYYRVFKASNGVGQPDLYTLSLPPLGFILAITPLALVKLHHHYYIVICVVQYYPHAETCWVRLPTQAMMACQHPWAQCGH